jgi:hypothetical protein
MPLEVMLRVAILDGIPAFRYDVVGYYCLINKHGYADVPGKVFFLC